MTQVQEQDEAQEEPQTPVTTEELAEEEAEEEAAHERETAGDEPAEARGPMGDDPKAVKALNEKIANEGIRHAKRLGEILGDTAADSLPCPVCFNGLMGFVFREDAEKLTDDQKAAALTFLGQELGGGMPQTPDTETCSRCGGYGETANPTKSAHYLTSQCAPCGGQGYIKHAAPVPHLFDPPHVITAADAQANGVVGPCPLCNAPNSAGRPHFCNPVQQGVT